MQPPPEEALALKPEEKPLLALKPEEKPLLALKPEEKPLLLVPLVLELDATTLVPEDDTTPLVDVELDTTPVELMDSEPLSVLDELEAPPCPLPVVPSSNSPSVPVAQLNKVEAGTIMAKRIGKICFIVAGFRTTLAIVANSRALVRRNDTLGDQSDRHTYNATRLQRDARRNERSHPDDR